MLSKISQHFKKKWQSYIVQLIVIISIFVFFSWVKTLNMLDQGARIHPSSLALNQIIQTQPQSQSQAQTESNRYQLSPYQFNYHEGADQKNTLVYFFAPWCGVCHLSIDNLQENFANQPEKTQIIAVALDYQDVQAVTDFIDQHNLTFPVLLGNEQTKQIFKVSAYPSYYVLSPEGQVMSKVAGYSTELGIKLRL